MQFVLLSPLSDGFRIYSHNRVCKYMIPVILEQLLY